VDTDVTAALQAASDAQASADGKIRLFVSTPTVPYDIGDLWDTGSGIKRATTDVATGSAYSSSHWLLITDAEGSAAIAAGTALWNGVSGTGRPADDATVGATWGTDLIGKPSDSRLFSNLLKVEDWVIGTTGSQGSFSQNGQTSENKISLLIGPNEETQPVWEGTNDGVNDADAGWNHSNIPIDHAKSYRSIVWMMQNSSDGSMYHGCGGGSTNNLSGTANGNPYFWFGDLPVTDRWYMGVGIIHGSGYGTTDTGVSGIYDPMTGSKVISAIDYKNKVGASTQVHRSFHYYGTTVGSKAYFARPRFELIDGSEPSLASLLGGNAILNSVITDNIYSANTTTINGGNITTDSIKADSILIDGNIEFSSVASGVQFGKNSLGDSSPGAFFGRSGGVAGFSISSPTSSIYADSSGQLILNRVTLFASSPGPTSSYDGSGYHYYNIPTAMSVLSVIVVGAGAGAGNTAVPSRGTSPRDGGAGTSSWIEFYTGTNGSGNLITVAGVSRYTASGAPYTPYSVGSNNTNQPGYAGYNSSQPNSGGVGGGVKPYPINGGLPGSPGTRGGGGGGGGVRGYNGSPEAYVNRHANAGSTFSQYINRPSDANSVKIYLGVGGIGGYSTGTTKGGDGGAGFASMTDPYSGATEVDLIDLMNRVAALE